MTKRIFISADHGLAIVYFLQTDILPALLNAGVEVVVLTDDGLKEQIEQRFGQPGLVVEGLRFKQARAYFESTAHSTQYWLHFLRWMGGSNRVNLEAPNGHLRQMQKEATPRARSMLPLMRVAIGILRRSGAARRGLQNYQAHFTTNIYGDLFERYQPDFVFASTPGWRLDRFLLREAARRKIPTGAAGPKQPLLPCRPMRPA